MSENLITTDALRGVRVLGGKKGTKHIGKVRRFVFHPRERRVVGFIVKRPDLLWMFRRKDLFVSVNGYDIVDGRIVVRNAPDACDKGACKALGIDWDSCVLWEGLPLITESGEVLGTVGTVEFDRETGAIARVKADAGATANTLLGTRLIPSSLVRGFRRGIGAVLAAPEGAEAEQDDGQVVRGAVLVADEALDLAAEGSVAEKAGRATAIAADKVNRTVKPAVSKAAKTAGEAVNKGAKATGKRITETKDAFVEFKEEYDKARGPKAKAAPSVQKGAAPAASSKPVSRKNMFAAFKEEYDKARHGDE